MSSDLWIKVEANVQGNQMAQLGWRDGAHSGPESRHLEEVGIVQKRNDLIELDFFQSWHSFYFKQHQAN